MEYQEPRKYRHHRRQLVHHLEELGITHPGVLEAMGRVPRHLFVEPALQHRAYLNEALPIGLKQTISKPYTVAYQTSLLDPRPGERILEVGTGSGYQAAVLCEMGARVFSIERHAELYQRARRLLHALGYTCMTMLGDGSEGWPAMAPFDGILVTAGSPEIPGTLLEQLRVPGGRLIIPVGDRECQQMVRIIRTGEDTYEQETLGTFTFVPLISRNSE